MVTDVAPKIGGWVEKQYVNFPGQMVRKGQPLGTIYSPELVATEEEYLNALKYRGSLRIAHSRTHPRALRVSFKPSKLVCDIGISPTLRSRRFASAAKSHAP